MAVAKPNAEQIKPPEPVSVAVNPLGIDKGFVDHIASDAKEAVGTVLTAFLSQQLSHTEILNALGMTPGRTAVELARIAYAPGDEALTVEEVLKDAGIRSQLMRGDVTKAEAVLLLQEHYKGETVKVARLKIAARDKLMAISQLREILDMRGVGKAGGYRQPQKPATAPAPRGKVIDGGFTTTLPGAVSAGG